MTDSRILVDAFVPVDIILPAKAPDVTVDSQLEAEIEQIDRKTQQLQLLSQQQSTESLFETETTAVVPLGKDKFKEEEPLVIGFNGKEYQQVADALNVLIFQSKKGIKLRTSDVGFGFLIGNDVTGDNGRREQMLKVIHSTMKYISILERIIDKTKLLLAYPKCSFDVELVKVLLLQFIKNRFEAKGLVSDEGDSDEQVQEILTCLDAFKIRLEAEFARIRIEKRAFGTGIADYLTNVLSEEANTLDEQAAKMPKYVRVCPSVSVKKVCEELGIDYVESVPSMSKRSQQIIASSNQATVITSDGEHSFDVTEKEEVETDIHVHSTVTDLLVIPAPLSGAFKCNSLLQNGSIIFQDPLIFSAIRAFKSLVNLNRRSQYWTIETHARSGNITALLAQELSPRVFSFEESDIKIAALRDNFLRLNIPKSNVEIIKSDFLLAKTKDKAFSKVRYAVCAPPTTSGAIVDRYQYFYEQGEYPFVKFTSGDKDFLQMLQLSALNHVSTVPSLKYILYITRSTAKEENGQVVDTFIKTNKEWTPVPLESISSSFAPFAGEQAIDAETYLSVKPGHSNNGIFMALLMRITPNTLPAEEQPQITVEKEEEEVADMPTEIQLSTVRKVVKRRKSKKAPAPSSRKSSTASVANQRKSSSSTVKSVAASGTKASSRKSSTVIDGVKKPGGTSRKSLADSKISGSSRLLAQTTASSRRSSDIISVASRNSGSVASSVFHSHQPKKQAVFPKSIVSLGDALPPLSTSMPPRKHAW